MKKLLPFLFTLLLATSTFAQMVGPPGGMIGGVPSTQPQLSLTEPRITAGTAAGLTVNDAGQIRTQIYKVTMSYVGLTANAVTQDITIATLPAKTIVHALIADVVTPFVCASVCTTGTLSAVVGSAAGGTQYLESFDLDAAAATFGDADGEVGASMNAAGFTNGGYIPAWETTSAVSVRFTSGTGNLGNTTVTNLNAGSVTFYIIASVFP